MKEIKFYVNDCTLKRHSDDFVSELMNYLHKNKINSDSHSIYYKFEECKNVLIIYFNGWETEKTLLKITIFKESFYFARPRYPAILNSSKELAFELVAGYLKLINDAG